MHQPLDCASHVGLRSGLTPESLILGGTKIGGTPEAAQSIAGPSRNLRANMNSLISVISGTKVGEQVRDDIKTLSVW